MFFYSKKISSLKEELAKKDAELESAQSKIKAYRNKNSDLKEECDQLEEENSSLTIAKNELEENLKDADGYFRHIEKMYCNINLPEPTFRYAQRCIDSPLGLEFFDPILYRINSRYKNLIDLKADYLLEVYEGPISGLNFPFPDSERYSNMGNAYYELLRSYNIDTHDSNASVARSRNNLDKISSDF